MRYLVASVVFASVFSLAATASALSLSEHPTPGAHDSAGVAVGLEYVRTFEDGAHSSLQVPYGEAVLRKAIGLHQLDLRLSLSSLTLGGNFELTGGGGSVSVMLEPSLGVAYLRHVSDMSSTTTYTANVMQATPALGVLVCIGERFYVAPRLAYVWSRSKSEYSGGYGTTDTSTNETWVEGLAVGVIQTMKPFALTFELSVMRGKTTSSDSPSSPAQWVFYPSVGVQLVGE
jgi:hypothetical protein